MEPVIALTGATGYVGRFVTAELHRQGATVRALARLESNRGGFGGVIEWVAGDLRSSDALAQLVAGADAVVHLAYEHVPGRYRGGEGDNLAEWLDANMNGSLRLLLAARDAGVKRFIFLSSRAVFSQTLPGRELDETHPTTPDTHYGAYKAAVESFLRSFARSEGMETCTVRATGVYGLTWPPEKSKWWGLVQAVLQHKEITSSGGGTEVHGEDVARLIWRLLQGHSLTVEAVHMSDLYVTHRDVVRLARGFAGIPGDLPTAPVSPPANVLVSRSLAELGLTLGGVPALEATIAALVEAAQKARDE